MDFYCKLSRVYIYRSSILNIQSMFLMVFQPSWVIQYRKHPRRRTEVVLFQPLLKRIREFIYLPILWVPKWNLIAWLDISCQNFWDEAYCIELNTIWEPTIKKARWKINLNMSTGKKIIHNSSHPIQSKNIKFISSKNSLWTVQQHT